MRILVTGSSGQLGAEIAQQLSPAHSVTGLDRLPGQWTTHVGELGDENILVKAVKEAQVVIHTASLHARHLGTHSKQDFINVNISGMLRLLELCVEAGVERLVYTSTTSLYGFALVPTDKAVWVTEELPPQPRDIYDITKLAAEELCQVFALERGLKTICLRTGRFFNEPPEILAINRLYRGLDVRDAAHAHVLAALNQTIQFDVFNIAARYALQKSDLKVLWEDARPVLKQRYSGIEEIFRARGWQLPPQIDRVYVSEHARRVLGYQPQYNFEELIQAL